MKHLLTSNLSLALLGATVFFSACEKDEEGIKPYTVPTTYDFAGADYSSSTNRIRMAVELNSYLGSATSTVLDQAKANNLFTNAGSPFANAALNTAGISLAEKTADPSVYKGFIDQQVANSQANAIPAAKGTAGFIPRGTGKIVVGPQGLEYNQAVAKGMMGSLFFKEAMEILSTIAKEDNTIPADGTSPMQQRWDEAFGYLGIPADYDTARTYQNTEANRPLLWGGYLAERGKPIQAGGILFEAFRKGRAAIGAKDYAVRDQQIKVIQETWERLAAISALAYVNIPKTSANVGNLGTQFHALSEGYGFVMALKYRPAGSKLTAANYDRLLAILSTDFYELIDDLSFTKLKEAETILKTTYNL